MSKWNNLNMADRAAFMRVAMKYGINNLDEIHNAYNRFAEGGETDNTTVEGGTLPEVVVKPAQWQVDWKKNIPKEVRHNILNGLDSSYRQYSLRKTVKDRSKYLTQLSDKYGKYVNEDSNILSDEERNALLNYNKECENLRKNYVPNLDYTDVTQRLYNVWNEAGRPDIKFNRKRKRAHYNPLIGQVTVGSLKDVIAELAHPIQFKNDKDYHWYNLFKDVPSALYEEIIGNKKHYSKKGHYEYQTHKIIEPKLESYIYEGTPTEYIKNNKFEHGGPENISREATLSRANSVKTNYDEAKDFNMNPLVYAARKFAYDRDWKSGLSNCTLTATQWVNPNNFYKSASSIYGKPESGYTEINAEDALPGDLLISRNPEHGSYHTMLIEGFDNNNQPLLRYSRGGADNKENLVVGRTLKDYHTADNSQGGNHTEDHYYRPNGYKDNWLPEVLITAKRKKK